MAETIISLDYADSRLAFFEEQKKLHQQKLHWWKHQKPYKQYNAQAIHGRCSYHGEAICYFEDAINALKEPVRHGKWIWIFNRPVERFPGEKCYESGWECSECGAGSTITIGVRCEKPGYENFLKEMNDERTKYCPECGVRMDLKNK